MATKNQTKNTTTKKTKFFPVAVLKNGILCHDGHMVYADKRGRWLYVSEDGMQVYMYDDVSQLIRDVFRRGDDDYVVTGWDLNPSRFDDFINDAYYYYNAHFD